MASRTAATTVSNQIGSSLPNFSPKRARIRVNLHPPPRPRSTSSPSEIHCHPGGGRQCADRFTRIVRGDHTGSPRWPTTTAIAVNSLPGINQASTQGGSEMHRATLRAATAGAVITCSAVVAVTPALAKDSLPTLTLTLTKNSGWGRCRHHRQGRADGQSHAHTAEAGVTAGQLIKYASQLKESSPFDGIDAYGTLGAGRTGRLQGRGHAHRGGSARRQLSGGQRRQWP